MIYLANSRLELRGDGSGDIEKIQFRAAATAAADLCKVRPRTTVSPDLMQQIRFRRFEAEHSELKPPADHGTSKCAKHFARVMTFSCTSTRNAEWTV